MPSPSSSIGPDLPGDLAALPDAEAKAPALAEAERRAAEAMAAGDPAAELAALTATITADPAVDHDAIDHEAVSKARREPMQEIAPPLSLRVLMRGDGAEAERLMAKKQARNTAAFRRRVKARQAIRSTAESPARIRRPDCTTRSREHSGVAPTRTRGSRRRTSTSSSASRGDPPGSADGEPPRPPRRSPEAVGAPTGRAGA